MSLPLVLLHGWGATPALWDGLLARLDRRECLRPALPGHPDGVAAEGGVAHWAELLLAGLPARFDLCGWSLGGLLALAIAQKAPQRLRRLVLIGSSPCFASRADWPHGLDPDQVARFCSEFDEHPAELMKRFHALQAFGDGRRRAVVAALAGCMAEPVPEHQAGMAAGLQLLQTVDLRAALAELALPVRILHGRGDALMPVEGVAQWSSQLADGRVTIFDDCGHAPHLSRPEECALLLQGFLDD